MTSQREIRLEIPASKREQASERTSDGITQNSSRVERESSAGKRLERETGEKASNPSRSRRQNTTRVSLFFINHPIEQEGTSRCFISYTSFSLFFPRFAFLLSLLLQRTLPPVSFEPYVSFFFSLTPSILASFSPAETNALVTTRRTLCHPVPRQSSFFFCYFIQLFSREGRILLLPGRATPVFSGQ